MTETTRIDPASSHIPAPIYEFLIAEGGHRRVLRYLKTNGLSFEEAEDVSTEVIVKAIQHYDSLGEPENLKSWIWAITRSALLDARRRKHTNQTNDQVDDEAWDKPAETADATADKNVDSAETQIKRLDYAYQRFRSEHPVHADALEFFVNGNYTISELAGHLGRTEASTRNYLAVARSKLRAYLQSVKDAKDAA